MPESDVRRTIRGSHYVTVSCKCEPPTSAVVISALLAGQDGEYGKLEVTKLTLTWEALL